MSKPGALCRSKYEGMRCPKRRGHKGWHGPKLIRSFRQIGDGLMISDEVSVTWKRRNRAKR